VLIIRRSKLYYTASGIITSIRGRPVHRLKEDSLNKTFVHQVGYKNNYTEMHGQQNIKTIAGCFICVFIVNTTTIQARVDMGEEFLSVTA